MLSEKDDNGYCFISKFINLCFFSSKSIKKVCTNCVVCGILRLKISEV
nr:MAG TPA: hypothetical protein [Caudoviricetes sp.]